MLKRFLFFCLASPLPLSLYTQLFQLHSYIFYGYWKCFRLCTWAIGKVLSNQLHMRGPNHFVRILQLQLPETIISHLKIIVVLNNRLEASEKVGYTKYWMIDRRHSWHLCINYISCWKVFAHTLPSVLCVCLYWTSLTKCCDVITIALQIRWLISNSL